MSFCYPKRLDSVSFLNLVCKDSNNSRNKQHRATASNETSFIGFNSKQHY